MSRDAMPFASMLDDVLREVRTMLIEKNEKYGNSALEPVRIFSSAGPAEQIKVRLDDKLSRLKRGGKDDEDVELDLIGYLLLLRISKRIEGPGP